MLGSEKKSPFLSGWSLFLKSLLFGVEKGFSRGIIQAVQKCSLPNPAVTKLSIAYKLLAYPTETFIICTDTKFLNNLALRFIPLPIFLDDFARAEEKC